MPSFLSSVCRFLNDEDGIILSPPNPTPRLFFPPIVHGTQSIVMRDRETQRSRGFGFITFETEDEAYNAVNGMNETELDGRRIRVNIANARPSGGRGGGGGGWSISAFLYRL